MRTWFIHDGVSNTTEKVVGDEEMCRILKQQSDPGEEYALVIWFEDEEK
jgi:hypothetical protein